MRGGTRRLVVTAMFVALTTLGTMFLGIRGTTGYYHLGDGIFYAAAMLLGPVPGAVAGGLGGAIADLLGGYPVWAPWTLVIKGATGLVIGSLAAGEAALGRRLAGLVLGALITVVGYAVATTILYGWAAAVVEIWGTGLQTVLGIAVALALRPLLARTLDDGTGAAGAGG